MAVTLPATLPIPITEYGLVWIITHPAQDIHCYLSKAGLVPGSHSLIHFHAHYPNLPFRSIASDLKSRLENKEHLVLLLYSPSFTFPFNYASRLRTAIPDLQVALVYMAPPDRLFIGWALEWCRAAATSDEPSRGESLAVAHHASAWVKGSFEGTLDVLRYADIQEESGVDAVQIPSVLEAKGGGRSFCMAALIIDGNATNVFVDENGSLVLHNDMVEPISLWASHQSRFSSRVIVTWDANVNSTLSLLVIQTAVRAMSTVLGFPVYLFYLHPRPLNNHSETKWDPLLNHPIGCIAFLHRRHRLNLHKTLYITNRLLYPWLRRIPPPEWIQLDRHSIPRVTGRSVLTVVGIPTWLDEVDEPRFGPNGARLTPEYTMPCVPLSSGATREGGPSDGFSHSLHAGVRRQLYDFFHRIGHGQVTRDNPPPQDNVSIEEWIKSFSNGTAKASVSIAPVAPSAPQSSTSNSSQLGLPPPTMTQMFHLPAFTQAPGPLADSQPDSQVLRRLPSTFQNASFFSQSSQSQSQSEPTEDSLSVARSKPGKTRGVAAQLNLSKMDVLPQQAGKLGADSARANESGSDTDDGDGDESAAQEDDWNTKDGSPKARARGKQKVGTRKAAASAVLRKRKHFVAGISDEEYNLDDKDKFEKSHGDDDGDDNDFPVRRHKRARRSLAQAIADVAESTEPVASKEPSVLPPIPPTVAPIPSRISPSIQDLPPMPRFKPNQYLRPDTDTQMQPSQPLSKPSTTALVAPSSTRPKVSLVESLFGASRSVNPSRAPLRQQGPLAPPPQALPAPPAPPAPALQRPNPPARASLDEPTQVQALAPPGGTRGAQRPVTSIIGNLLGARPTPAAPLARQPEPAAPPPKAVPVPTLGLSRPASARPLGAWPAANADRGGLLSDMLFVPRKGGKPWSAPSRDEK